MRDPLQTNEFTQYFVTALCRRQHDGGARCQSRHKLRNCCIEAWRGELKDAGFGGDGEAVDLDGSETIDGGGLEALLMAQEALRALSGDLKISTSNPANRKILEITRLDEQVEVYDTVIDAVKSFA